MSTPTVSVIIPARNAATTLPATIAALLAQTSPDWEAIVVDDGSNDRSRLIALDFASVHPRIRVIATGGGGVSAARNLGIGAASADWLLFLDADDWVLPAFVERMTEAARHNPGAAAIYCGWMRVGLHGQIVTRDLWPPTAEMFPIVARQCPFAIHSCMVRTADVRSAGGFDESLIASEDWDLWQRIARCGGRFVQVAESLACYRLRADSASFDARQLLVDGLRVIARGHAADPRVDPATVTWPNGLSPVSLARTRLGFYCWAAGVAISKGQDPIELLALVADDRSPEVDPSAVADALFRSIPLQSGRGPEAWTDLWPVFTAAVERFVDVLERHSGTPQLMARTMANLERLVVERAPAFPVSVGRQHAVVVEGSRRIAGLTLPRDAERVLVVVTYQEARLGAVDLPVCDGAVTAAVLSDAVAAKFAWPILARLLEPVYPTLRIVWNKGRASVHRNGVSLGTDLTAEDVLPERLHDTVGWTVLLQELFARPDIGAADFYDESWTDPQHIASRRVREGDWVRIEATSQVPALQGPAADVLVELTVGGSAVALLRIDVSRRGLPAHALRARLILAGGLELLRATVREGVLQATAADTAGWRAQLVQRAAEMPEATADSEPHHRELMAESAGAFARAMQDSQPSLLIGRRAGLPVGSSASRRAAFPSTTAAELRAAALAAGELVIDRQDQSPSASVSYVPELFPRPAPASRPSNEPRSGPAPTAFGRHHFETIFASPDPWKYTSAYEQTKYDHTLSLLPDGVIDMALEVGCAEGHFTRRLAARVGRLVAADISHLALNRASARCAGLPNTTFERIDVVADALPPNQDLIVCSEMLYYVGDRRRLGVVAGKLRDALKPGGYLLAAHANTTSDGIDRPAFEWDVPFGARTIGRVIGRVAGLTAIAEVRTPLYRVALFRRSEADRRSRFNPFARRSSAAAITEAEHAPLTPEVASHVRWHRSPSRGCPPPPVLTRRLPILMYHRVAAAGAAATAPYRVAPRDFEDQLLYLRGAGFRSISLDDWRQATERRRPIDGRAVILTFDDGFADFEEEAWPLLRKYGFGAIVFLVSDLVGGANGWDSRLGERMPLLDWPAVARLEDAGVEFGAHSATHQAMTGLSPADIVREASRCRTTLFSHLRQPLPAFAYPFGDVNGVVQHLVGACGYQFGVTCDSRLSRQEDGMMALPRIEVRGGETLADFIAHLSDG